ncbi:ATP synthase subunit I [Falsiroseomonas sp.]|uniref:N-ATPase subunit AtpR n=1 Tax=Falsiroseomonas sp. TaxID=2870721 RepID=UPI002736017F|nr:ATP synthase subunit I [Falsiroseomonas sp.]MDP3414764.1 ATP synthase subunit I [Falsiroseomonas sp.]
MSASPFSLLASVLVGAAIGALYLALLWMAVRRLPQDRGGLAGFVWLRIARAALLVGAMAAAVALAVPAEGFVAALVGFIIARLAGTRLARRGTPGGAEWK